MPRVLEFPRMSVQPAAPRECRSAPEVPRAETGLLTRGVWKEPYKVRGGACLVAVSAAGEEVARAPIPEEADASDVILLLDQLLAMVDPAPSAPRLELVR